MEFKIGLLGKHTPVSGVLSAQCPCCRQKEGFTLSNQITQKILEKSH